MGFKINLIPRNEKFYSSLMNGLPWILITVGFMCVITGYLFQSSTYRLDDVSITLGGAVLSGGVFAVILKSFQFTGIFKEELSKIIYGNEFLNKLSDIEKKNLWKKVTSSIHKDNFPNLSDKIHEGIITNYFPTEKRYYLENYKRYCKVRWINSMDRIVESDEEVSVDIIPKSEYESIINTFSYTATIDTLSYITNIKLIKLDIDGKDYTNYMEEVITVSGNKTTVKYSYTIQLKGKKKYVLRRKLIKTFSLSNDPYSRYYSETFISGTSIRVKVESEGLRVQFVESGTDKQFENRWENTPTTDCGSFETSIDKDFKELLFPKQGYVLHYECDVV